MSTKLNTTGKTDNSNGRKSSFELLRIIAMFSIVIFHFALHGGFSFDSQTVSVPRF